MSEMTQRRRVRVDDHGKKPKQQPPPAAANEPAPPAGCTCPRLEQADWNDVESDWSDIAFLKTSTNALFGVPMGYDAARTGLEARAEKLGLTIPDDAIILLGAGQFRRPILLEVENVPPGTKGVIHPGGIAYSQLVEAPWGEMRHKAGAFTEAATERYGRKPDDVWIWYLTCRECSHERNFETLLIAHYRQAPAAGS